MHRPSLAVMSGVYSLVAVRGLLFAVASLIVKHELYRAHRLQYLPHAGLVAPWCVDSSGTKDRNCVPCIGGQILNHWTTREILSLLIKRLMKSLLFGQEAFFRLCTLGYTPLRSKQRL